MKLYKRLELFFEFLVFGVAMGVVEDIIAVRFSTGEPITLKIIGVVVLVTIPFAFIGELVVDKVDFSKTFKKFSKKK